MTDLLSPSDTGEIQLTADPSLGETRDLTGYYRAAQFRSPLPRPDVSDTLTMACPELPHRAGVVMPEGFQPPPPGDKPVPKPPTNPPVPPPAVDGTATLTLLESFGVASYDYPARHRREPVWAWRFVGSGAALVLLSVVGLLAIVALSGCRVLEPSPQKPGSTYRVPDAGMPQLNPASAQDDTAWIGGER